MTGSDRPFRRPTPGTGSDSSDAESLGEDSGVTGDELAPRILDPELHQSVWKPWDEPGVGSCRWPWRRYSCCRTGSGEVAQTDPSQACGVDDGECAGDLGQRTSRGTLLELRGREAASLRHLPGRLIGAVDP